jgi:hypothetical protein
MTTPLTVFIRGFAPPVRSISVCTFLLPAWASSTLVQQQVWDTRRGDVRQCRASQDQFIRGVRAYSTVPSSPARNSNVEPPASSEPPTRPAASYTDRESIDPSDFKYPLSILDSSRNKSPRGLLATLALEAGELKGFHTLAQALIQIQREPSTVQDEVTLVSVQSSLFRGAQATMSLEKLTNDWFSFDILKVPSTAQTPLAQATEDWQMQRQNEESRAHHEAIGELWYTLGEIAIRASNWNISEGDRLMHHAYIILAEMHSHGLVPSDAYGFENSSVPRPRRKPPYLHILGSRMMATISDAKWKAQSYEGSAAGDQLTSDVPENLYDDPNPRVRRLHPNVWLEFILWACVRQGYFIEAAKLLSISCLAQGGEGWMALSWDQVLELQIDHHKRHQSWFDRVMTLVEGYSEGL